MASTQGSTTRRTWLQETQELQEAANQPVWHLKTFLKIRSNVHLLLRRQAEGAAVGQLRDVDREALVSGLVAEAELHLGAAQRQPLVVGAREEVGGEARPTGSSESQGGTGRLQGDARGEGKPCATGTSAYLRSDGS